MDGCSNITSVTFEEGITTIPSFLCEGLTGITEITIPNSVKEIENYAFQDCTKLAKINFGTGVESLGRNAFKNCTSLTSLFIPKSLVGYCPYTPFEGCSNITTVKFEEGITEIPGYLCAGLTEITEITIPNSVKEIGVNAFADCKSLKKITILDNVEYMGLMLTQKGDTVFKNHNEDLTVYCYEGSIAAKYAIDRNIKYVYLERPTVPEDKPEVDTNKSEENKQSSSIQNDKTNNEEKKDNTTAPGKLPYTGGTFVMIMTAIGIIAIGLYAYKRNNDLKGI